LNPGTLYYLRAYATNNVGTSYGTQLTFTTLGLMIPSLTTAVVTNVYPTTASSGGNVSTDGGAPVTARGVCWNTSSAPSISNNHTTDGSGAGPFVSNMTGLTPNTLYYIRAYATNSVGTAYGNEIPVTTLSTWACGVDITHIHDTLGGVAAINKFVTYPTRTNIPGELTKCWIWNNLGSNHIAYQVNDPSESTAGWYWQFNRKQGYMHDGVNRTPNTPWITSINENLDWQATNDPCALELANGWRIPTQTEWYNVDLTGNWVNWNSAFNGGLRLHAAGGLGLSGSLVNRGVSGYYWSNTQNGTDHGWELLFNEWTCYLVQDLKAGAAPVRCIKD
jgi:hypothetical protein